MHDPIYRLPPVIPGEQFVNAAAVGDQMMNWGMAAQGVPEAWKRAKGRKVVAAILDTGIPDHPDVAPAIKERINCTPFPMADVQGHATHVHSIFGARGRLVGVAPESEIISIKVLGDDGTGQSTWIERGIKEATKLKPDLILMSLGGPFHQGTADACQEAFLAGIKMLVAGGNSGPNNVNVDYPARLSYIVAVAAYGEDGRLADFSSRGKDVDVAFPGANILGCWPGGQYKKLSGTSMATPFGGGTAALRLSYEKDVAAAGSPVKNPTTNNRVLLDMLKEFAIDDGPPGRDNGWGWGRLDLNKYMNPELTQPTPAPAPTPKPGEPIELFSVFGVRIMAEVGERNGAPSVCIFPG